MRRRLYVVLALVGITTVVITCGEKDDGTKGNGVVETSVYHSQVIKPFSNTVVKSGAIVPFSLAINEYGKGSDSVSILLDGRKIYTSVSEKPTHDISIPTDSLTMGNHEI
ncbi:MAG: hypothetical protein ACHQF2_11715, partial [Flavobacteriales bacterium]